MAGRKLQWRIAACESAIRGETVVKCFNKQGLVSAWLTLEEIKDPHAALKKYQSMQVVKPKSVTADNVPQPVVPTKDTDYKPKGEICFIIANGESRRGFDLHKLTPKGYVIGMNVLPIVEDFWPDALISVDIATVKYICDRDVPAKLEMWSYPRGGVKDPRVNRIAKDWGWSSGPTATRIALEYKKFQTIYILGMDFFGITEDGQIDENKGRKINNMYKGMDRYRKPKSDRTYFGNWLNQMITNTTNHPHVNFYHVVREDQKSPNKLAQKTNWIDLTYNVFEEHLSKMPKKSS